MIPREMNGIGSASGKIISASTAGGVKNIALKVRKGMNNIYTDILFSTKSGTNGSYSVSGLEAGNYCIEMVCDDSSEYISSYFNIKILGNELIGGQNGIISTKLASNQLRAVLTWGDMPKDLDAHMKFDLSSGKSGHVYYSTPQYKDSGQKICILDVDDTNEYGPETITIYSGATGQYQYYVHQYTSLGHLEDSGASVKIYMNGEAYPKYTFHVPQGNGWYWYVFQYNSATGRIIPINEIR